MVEHVAARAMVIVQTLVGLTLLAFAIANTPSWLGGVYAFAAAGLLTSAVLLHYAIEKRSRR